MQNTISQFLEKDHLYLDQLWADFFSGMSNLKLANDKYQKFYQHHLQHIRLEDEFLFPRLSEILFYEKNSSIVKVAFKDHQAIIKLHQFVQQAFQNKDNILLCSKNLNAALQKHRAREAKLHYPVSDKFIPLAEWKKMIKIIYGITA